MSHATFFILPAIDQELRTFVSISLQGRFKERHYLKYLYVLNLLLYYQTYFVDLYNTSGVTINRDQLAATLGLKGCEASAIIRHLSAWQLIEKVRGYREGFYSRAYRLNERLEALRVSVLTLNGSEAPFLRRLIRQRREQLEGSWLLTRQYEILTSQITVSTAGIRYLVKKYRNEHLTRLLNHYRQGYRFTEQQLNELFQHIRLHRADLNLLSFITGAIFIERPEEDSRLYTNLATLKRTFRQFLLLDGRPLLMTDISNSQILFSVIVIGEHLQAFNQGRRQPRVFAKYKDLALSGQFYEGLASAAGYPLNAQNRSEFKKAFFREVFFSKTRARGRIKQAFKRTFPAVAKAINQIKKGDYTTFATRLQRMEAEIIIESVLVPMLTQGIAALSIHDSIVVNDPGHLDYAEALIKETMQIRYGLTPTFKR